MKKLLLLLLLIIVINNFLFAQNKKPLDFQAYNYWKTLENQKISNNGQWACYESVPYKTDLVLNIVNPNTNTTITVDRAEKSAFSPSSKFIAFTIKPEYEKIKQLKEKKIGKSKFPKDSLGILIFNSNKTIKFKNLKIYKLPQEKSEWIAYLQTPYRERKKNTTKTPKLYNLKVFNPINYKLHEFKNVSEMTFSKTGKLLGFIKYNNNNNIIESTVKILNTETGNITKIFNKKGFAKKISFDNTGNNVAFVFTEDSTKQKKYDIYLWKKGNESIEKININKDANQTKKNLVVSEYGKIWFSEDGTKLYFGISFIKKKHKSNTLKEKNVELDIWSWNDDRLQSQQLASLKKDKRKNYLTVYHLKTGELVKLESELIDNVKTILKGNGNIALGIAKKPYSIENSWTYPNYKDIYIIDVKTGEKKLIQNRNQDEIDISTYGNYVFWFNNSNWYAYNIKTKETKSLTQNININFNKFTHNYPFATPSYSYAGWSKDDKYFMVYGKHDIWKLDPNAIETPVNFTNNYGRANNIKLRYLNLDKEKEYIDLQNTILLSGFNYTNKQSGYFQKNIYKKAPIKIVMDDYRFYNINKAKNSNALIWRKSSVKEFSNLWYSKNEATTPIKISNMNQQQKNYNWASSELVKWKSYCGKNMEGILYKPENFDASKKYPMIVHFYELKSQFLHAHYFITPSISSINPIFYASNGYLIFIPDVKYNIGHPGESAYNCVVSGTKALINKGFVDVDKIGIQGQSWGGYQVAYIITQINLFSAASVGSPVSNLTSAYGAVRDKSGTSRMSQYENYQGRIGANLWKGKDLYIDNSPLFSADQIETPLLIRHNDKDGIVPWQQSIELFTAMRRLKKKVWLLNYNNQGHYLKKKSPESKDFSIRMMQFFDYYLKNKNAPIWLKNGVPALEK